MKNFTVKKVALGLLLAGYAASSAFAISGVTQEVIAGNAPVMKAEGSAQEHTMAVYFKRNGTLLTNNDTLKVGDTVHIQYQLIDADGDTDTVGIKNSLAVFVKNNEGNWDRVNVDASTPTYNNDGTGEISFAITKSFVGKTQIGLKILERTDFGYPVANQWLTISDIFANSSPGTNTPNNPNNPGDGPRDPGNPPEPTGPGLIDPNNIPRPGPIEPDNYQVYIYKVDSSGNIEEGIDYVSPPRLEDGSKAIPKYGEKFAVVVKSTEDGDDYTSRYAYEWYVTGSYETPDGTKVDAKEDIALSGTSSRRGVNDVIFLGSDSGKHNSMYSSDYKAGIQGYKLAVRTK
jgi:hypothetical protein